MATEFYGPQAPNCPTPLGTQVCNQASGAAAQVVATLAAAAGKYNYLTGIIISGLGATGATGVIVVVDGILGGPISFTVPILAGATTAIIPFIWNPTVPLRSSDVNTAITVTVPSFGTGNTSARVVATGFQVAL